MAAKGKSCPFSSPVSCELIFGAFISFSGYSSVFPQEPLIVPGIHVSPTQGAGDLPCGDANIGKVRLSPADPARPRFACAKGEICSAFRTLVCYLPRKPMGYVRSVNILNATASLAGECTC